MERSLGRLLMLTGLGHVVVGLVLFHEPVVAIYDAGVFNTVQPPLYSATPLFDRIAAFSFLMLSPVLFMLGQLASRAVEQQNAHTLTTLGWYLLAIGVVGSFVVPISGNWILIGLGALALRAGRLARP